jgi:glycosyltransferase involved in cell wall biosynthesis
VGHISLCVLSYNRLEFLQQTINSAIAGAHEPMEIIVHDDGSDDPRIQDSIVQMLRSGHISHAILNPPGYQEGQGTALNRMFHMATGDLIIKADHDLVYHDGWLAKVRDIMVDERVGLLGLFKYWHEPVDWRKTGLPGLSCEFPTHTYHTHICGSVMVIPREVWETLGPFEEHSDAFAEDAEMQRWVYESDRWDCALPDEDLVVNRGFGIGPSTVVEEGMVVHRIHHGPLLVTK